MNINSLPLSQYERAADIIHVPVMATVDTQDAVSALYEKHVLQIAAPNNKNHQPRDIQTTLHYHPLGAPPKTVYYNRPETYVRPIESHAVTVHDVTGRENDYTLDKSGFQFHRHTAAEKDFLDEEQVKAVYYPEIDQLLKEV
jgi:hypothetical protein